MFEAPTADPSQSYSSPDLNSARTAARLGALVKEHHAMLWRYLLRMGVLEADVDDALQEVILIAARKLEVIDHGSERAFLFSSAYRVAVAMRRRAFRRHEIAVADAGEAEDHSSTAEALVDQKRLREQLDSILDRMPVDTRSVFVMFEIEELTMAEIALASHLSPGTVASRLRRAREQFNQASSKLVHAGRAHSPSSKSLQRALVTVTAAASVTAGTSASSAGALLWIPLAKWLGVGLVAGGMTVGTWQAGEVLYGKPAAAQPSGSTAVALTRGQGPEPAISQVFPEPSVAASVPTLALSVSIVAAVPPMQTEEVAEEEPLPVAPAPSASVPPVPVPTMADELGSLEKARKAVLQGDGSKATQALDEHMAMFSRGRFVPEAQLLRIEAMMLRGDRAGAKALGEQFIASHPGSPLVRRVKSLIGEEMK